MFEELFVPVLECVGCNDICFSKKVGVLLHFHVAVWVGLLRLEFSTKVIWQRQLYLVATSFL